MSGNELRRLGKGVASSLFVCAAASALLVAALQWLDSFKEQAWRTMLDRETTHFASVISERTETLETLYRRELAKVTAYQDHAKAWGYIYHNPLTDLFVVYGDDGLIFPMSDRLIPVDQIQLAKDTLATVRQLHQQLDKDTSIPLWQPVTTSNGASYLFCWRENSLTQCALGKAGEIYGWLWQQPFLLANRNRFSIQDAFGRNLVPGIRGYNASSIETIPGLTISASTAAFPLPGTVYSPWLYLVPLTFFLSAWVIKNRPTHPPRGSSRLEDESGFFMADLHISPQAMRAYRNGNTIELTRRELRILALLYEKAGHVVSRDELYDICWGRNHIPTSRALDQYIASLRKKVEREPAEPEIIKTVRGAGYRFDQIPDSSAALTQN